MLDTNYGGSLIPNLALLNDLLNTDRHRPCEMQKDTVIGISQT
jgi:hypothetical protein